MPEEAISDLKQFISGAIMQQTAYLSHEIAEIKHEITGIKQDVAGLKQDVLVLKADVATLQKDVLHLQTGLVALNTKVDEGFAAMAEALDTHTVYEEWHLYNHHNRLLQLEGRGAS